jgi:NitT/TauT family transport system substrate-binding protein
MQALVAGDLDIVVTSAPNVVNPRLGGADMVMILSIIPTFIDHIISAPNIMSPEQLRGKIGSVNRFGSISEMGLRLSLKRLGIDPEKDVQIVPAGGNPERLAAISKGYCSVYDHERVVYQRSRAPRLSRSGQHGDVKNPAARQRHRY